MEFLHDKINFDEFYSIFYEVLCNLKLEDEMNNLNKHIKRRHSIEDIKALLKRNEFSVTKIIRENYIMRFVDGSSFFNHYFIKLAFLQDWKEIIRENNLNNVFLNLKNKLNNIAGKEGEIVFKVPIAYIECEKL